MYVLQHKSPDGVFTFTQYTYISDVLHALRTEYGLSESEYHETMISFSWERPAGEPGQTESLYWFLGEIPEASFVTKSAAEALGFRAAIKK